VNTRVMMVKVELQEAIKYCDSDTFFRCGPVPDDSKLALSRGLF
jgi:hypothetical protein